MHVDASSAGDVLVAVRDGRNVPSGGHGSCLVPCSKSMWHGLRKGHVAGIYLCFGMKQRGFSSASHCRSDASS